MFTYGFYNSLNGDRKYNAEQMSAIFDGLIGDGVFATIGNIFDVTPGSGLEVIVDEGKAWFNHTWNVNDSKMPLSLSAADVSYSRIDAVVLEINKDNAVRENSIKIVEGTPASSPQKPTLSQETPVWQYPLAYVTVPANAGSVTIANIEKTVGQAPCPFVTGILKTVDISVLFTTWQGTFEDWFEHLKIELSGDVAGNLQRQIDEINDQLTIMTKDLSIMRMTVTYDGVNPVVGVFVTNIWQDDLCTVPATTGLDGVVRGYVKEGENVEFGIKNYADIDESSKLVKTIDKGVVYTESLTVTARNFVKILASQDVYFSPNVESIDFTLVGGGGASGFASLPYADGTASAYNGGGGGGGGGGAVVIETGVQINHNKAYPVSIGAGGAAVTYTNTVGSQKDGGNGGTSSFDVYSAPGGSGGTSGSVEAMGQGSKQGIPGGAGGVPNGGKGGRGVYAISSNDKVESQNGSDGILGYDSYDTETYYGGGGGGGSNTTTMRKGGNGGGGNGAYYANMTAGTSVTAAKAGTANTGGGGGGPAVRYSGSNNTSLKGGSGVLAIRMHLTYGG